MTNRNNRFVTFVNVRSKLETFTLGVGRVERHGDVQLQLTSSMKFDFENVLYILDLSRFLFLYISKIVAICR